MVLPALAARALAGRTAASGAAKNVALHTGQSQGTPRGASTEKEAPKPIDFLNVVLLLFTALIFDGIQGVVGTFFNLTGFLMPLGVGLNMFIMIVAQCVFFIWLLLLGRLMVKNMKGAVPRFTIFITEFIVETIPVVNAIPAITGGIISFLLLTAAEDAVAQGKTLPFGLERLAGTISKSASSSSQSIARSLQYAREMNAADATVRNHYADSAVAGQEGGQGGDLPQKYAFDITRAVLKTTRGKKEDAVIPLDTSPEEVGGYEWYEVVDANNTAIPNARVRLAWLRNEGSPRSKGFEFVEPTVSKQSGVKTYRFVRRGQVRSRIGSETDFADLSM